MLNKRLAMTARQLCVTDCYLAKAARRLTAIARHRAVVA
jgi:hypothetical protein